MSKNILEWEKVFENMASEDREGFIDAVNTLMAIEPIWEEYSWTGLKTLKIIAEQAQEAQERGE